MMHTDAIWRACRIILDVKLHRGEIGVADAIDFLVEQTGFERPNAAAEVKRYTYTPTYQLSYLLGKVLLLRLREDEKRRLGDQLLARAASTTRCCARAACRSASIAASSPADAARSASTAAEREPLVMQIIPSIDLKAGRSRLVFWPGAATGSGTPTDRPERIARHFVELGAHGAPPGRPRRRRRAARRSTPTPSSASRAPSPCRSSWPAASTARSRSSWPSPPARRASWCRCGPSPSRSETLRACLARRRRLAGSRHGRARRSAWPSTRGTARRRRSRRWSTCSPSEGVRRLVDLTLDAGRSAAHRRAGDAVTAWRSSSPAARRTCCGRRGTRRRRRRADPRRGAIHRRHRFRSRLKTRMPTGANRLANG